MRKIRRKVNKPLLYFVFFIFASVSVGYAALSTTLSITGKSTLSKNSWDIHFENFVLVHNGASKVTTAPTIDSTKTKVSFNITLSKPGDSYEFTVDAVNKGTIDAMLSGFSATSLTTDQQKYLTYTVTYSDGEAISTKDYLKKGTKETIKVSIFFKEDLSAADLPSSAETLNLTATLTYVQADSTAKTRTQSILCKLVESNGSEELNLGDKFYCDVNGDKTYDSSTEVFYYLTDSDSIQNTAVLIYNSHVSPDYVKYNEKGALNGPVTARSYLPTTSDWPNVTLAQPVRNITSQSGTTIKNFSYSGYAARLPSLKEVLSCANDQICPIENGDIFWLEDPCSDTDALILFAPAFGYQQIRQYSSTTAYGNVVPVIEVPKSRISY